MNRLNDLKNIINILGNALRHTENYAIMNGYRSQKKECSEYDYFNENKINSKTII